MFATPTQLGILNGAKRWYLDGTFKIIKEPFMQLFSIHAFISKEDCLKQVPLVFVMMSRRRKQDYVAVFERLNEVLDNPKVQGFVLDFEAAAWFAMQFVYPGTQVKGCSFHWAQAVMKRVGQLGLRATYLQRQGAHLLIRKILALPFLPADHIVPAFNNLRLLARTPPLMNLVTYLENTWIHNANWTVAQWSVFRQSVRTNNDVEGWHRRINGKAGRAKVQFYLLVPLLRRESKTVGISMRQVEEQTLSRYQNKTYRQLQGKTVELWDLYEGKLLNTSDFLRKVGNLYATSLPTTSDTEDDSI